MMIGYITLGTNNLAAAVAFYDKVFKPLEVSHVMEVKDHFVAWGKSMAEPSVSVTVPFNKQPATPGNGTMVALDAKSRATVDAIYALAMENGGTCEGKPGIRAEYGPEFYVAYFRDLDGNKLNAFCMGPA